MGKITRYVGMDVHAATIATFRAFSNLAVPGNRVDSGTGLPAVYNLHESNQRK